MNKLKKNIYLSLLVAIGLGLSIIEAGLPSLLIIPGAKLGFSNIVILTAIVLFGFKESIIIAILKSLLLVLGTGNVIGIFYSLTAGLASAVFMNICYNNFLVKIPVFSLVGISIIGAIIHNLTQVTVAALMLNNVKIYNYLPIMTMVSLITGYFVGMATFYITENLTRKKINGEFK